MYSDTEMSLRKDALIAALEFTRERDVKHQEVLLAAEDFYQFLSRAHDETTYVLKVESAAKPEPEAATDEKPKAKRTAKKQEKEEQITEPEEPTDSSTLTQKEVIDVLREMMGKTDRETLARVLKKFGATRASDLGEQHYRAVFDIAQAVLIEDDTEAVLKKYGVK